MSIIELQDYTLAPSGSGSGINGFYFALAIGDVCAIEASNPDDAHQFLRALATLAMPLKGIYKFKDKKQDFSNYHDVLRCKRKIGYIAQDAALISNITVRQNLLMTRYYFENNLNIDLDDDMRLLCRSFGLEEKLDKRPAELNSMEAQAAIVIREISKQPLVFLLQQPEDFIGHARFDLLVKILNDWIAKQAPIVFLSYDRRLIRRFANRKILITDGSLTTVTTRQMGAGE